MSANQIYENAQKLSVTVTHPTNPASGNPCRVGDRTGVAMTTGVAGLASVDFSPAGWNLPVKGVNDAGNVAVAVMDALFYVDADVNDGTGFLSRKTSGRFFGFALAAVNSGATATVGVAHVDTVDPGTSQDPTNNVIQISKQFVVANMVDDLGTSGHIDFDVTIPANAVVVGWKAVTTGGFSGDTTAVVQVGKAGALADYSQTTNGSCLAAGTVASAVPVATARTAAVVTPRVTITGAADFTSIVTAAVGAMTVTLSYVVL